MSSLAIMSDHTKIAYEEIGYGPSAIFIHGWAATKNFWNAVRTIENFRIILFDLRGHGESDKPKHYSYDRILRDVYELITGLGVRDLYLVGHSMGGIIATKIATLYADFFNVKKLVLVATPPEMKLGFLKRTLMSFMLIFLTPLLRKTFTPKTLYEPKEEILRFIWEESAKGSKRAYIKYLKIFDNVSITQDLEQIRAEKIAIIPSHDKIVPTDIQKQVYSELCDKIITIENVGHNVMLEKPEEFRKIIQQILQE